MVECHAKKKLVHHLPCQGHSEGFFNQNMTVSAISPKLLATKLGVIGQHHRPDYPVEKWDYSVQGQSDSESSNV